MAEKTYTSLKAFARAHGAREDSAPQNKRRKRHGKSRAKMWYITRELLPNSPHMTDADVQRRIHEKFGEGVAADVLKEARWIFTRKVDAGEIVVNGQRANLRVVMDLYASLTDKDRFLFNAWVASGCPENVRQAYRHGKNANKEKTNDEEKDKTEDSGEEVEEVSQSKEEDCQEVTDKTEDSGEEVEEVAQS